ncbi:MAG: CarboxypepD reg-like domain, partial [Bacteroidota bacterium]
MRLTYALLIAIMISWTGIDAFAQTMISGKVTNNKTNEPLKGATVRVEGTTLGGLTAKDGSYT